MNGVFRAARRDVIGDEHRPPSTLLIVKGLAAPEIWVEIEAFAREVGLGMARARRRGTAAGPR